MHFARIVATTVVMCVTVGGCANGLSGAPSPGASPAAAADLARQKAMQVAQRESQGAVCFPQAVLPDAVKPLPLMPATAPGAAGAAPAPPAAPPVLSAAQARTLRAPRNLLPVYCRNLEPASVRPARSPTDKLREAAARFSSAGIVVDATEIEATLRVRGETRYAHVDVRDTGIRHESYVDRYGQATTNPNVTLQGGRRIVTPVLSYKVDPVMLARTVEVPGRYTEGWVLVRVPEAVAKLHHLACVLIATEAEHALVDGDRAALHAHFEKIRTCDFYGGLPIRSRTSERPPVVWFQPEEP